MDFELALSVPDQVSVPVLPLRLAYRRRDVILLDHEGGLENFVDDWEAANDIAGIYGRIIQWYEQTKRGRAAIYGFETTLLGPGRHAREGSVWLTFDSLHCPMLKICPTPDTMECATPMSGAEYVRATCTTQLSSIQTVLEDEDCSELEEEIRAAAPWLRSGVTMAVGAQLCLCGEDVPEQSIVFNFPDRSQMGLTANAIHVLPVTFCPGNRNRMLWTQFGTA